MSLTTKPTTQRHFWKPLWVQLQQPQVFLAFWLALLIGMIEPLACVLHCQFWLPLTTVTREQPHQHGLQSHIQQRVNHHEQVVAAGRPLLIRPAPSVVSTATMPAAVHFGACDWHWHNPAPTDSGTGIAPAPFHEMALLALLSIALLTVFARSQPLQQRWVVLCVLAPPWRPPIILRVG
jgi:hypothetical protein